MNCLECSHERLSHMGWNPTDGYYLCRGCIPPCKCSGYTDNLTLIEKLAKERNLI